MLRARFSPITASPIIPTCAVFVVCSGVVILLRPRGTGDGQRLADDFIKASESGGRVRAEFDADCAAASRGERAGSAEALLLFERREGEGLARYLNVAFVRGRELHEDAAGRASLVQLTGR